jgi:hypothetical protein
MKVDKAAPPGDQASVNAEDRLDSLSFKVRPDFKREFKVFAVSQGMSMLDLLKEGFALSKQRRK